MRRGLALVGVAFTLITLTGCHGPAQYAVPQVNILFRDDGTAEMNWALPSSLGSETSDYLIEFALALGLPAPDHVDDDSVATWTGLSTDRIELDVAQLLRRFDELDLGSDGSFVTFCVPQAQGRMHGAGMDFEHFGSCATYLPGQTGFPDDLSATVGFKSRLHPAIPRGIGMVAAALLGIVAWEIRRRSRTRLRFAMQALAFAGLATCVILTVRTWWIGAVNTETDAPGWSVGLDFDNDFVHPFTTASWVGAAATLVTVIAFVLRRKLRYPPSPPSDLGQESVPADAQ